MAIRLITTPKLPIINGHAQLPHPQASGILRGQSMVYDTENVVIDHGTIELARIGQDAYAVFPAEINGFAVVSYLADV